VWYQEKAQYFSQYLVAVADKLLVGALSQLVAMGFLAQ